MPRESEEDLYPEEIAAGHTIALLPPRHTLYLQTATTLRAKYADKIHILIGFEGEWIRSSYGPFIQEYASDPRIDFFIGSVHHVHGIPIDYDAATYAQAVEKAGSEEKLFEDYYDSQHEMLRALKPRVVGHFDLIRLLAKEPDADLKTYGGGRVWEKAIRNLEIVKEQGALLEVNSAGLRKGLKEPYPGKSVCEVWKEMGGKFTLSDDSHGIAQVGTNYVRMLDYLDGLGVEEVWTLEKLEGKELVEKKVTLKEVRETFKA
ncbi:PHP [Glarea lozoyensis ATCC 20868]|nr:PHP [Glarea lozoyensis ATCC 20868]EPE28277.1 PHP [Glarea lozoyensis ATCC 20868]